MDNPNYILNELNKGIKMGMDSTSNVAEKVQDDRLKQDLKFQYDEYNRILNNVNDTLTQYNDFPKDLNPMLKTMGWMNVEWNTLDDKSNSNIAEMMIKGTNMGIIKGVKLLNHNPDTDDTIKNILTDFIQFQENTIDQLKKYL